MNTTLQAPAPTSRDIDRSPVSFVLLKRNRNNPGEGNMYPAAIIVPTIDEIYEEYEENGVTKQRNRIIRYIPGEPSIYADEQSEDAKYRPEPIVIKDGLLIIDHREVLLIQYLRISNYNSHTLNRMPGTLAIYKEHKAEEAAQTYLEEQKEDLDMKNLIYNLDPYELESYALVLGDQRADSKKTDEIRRDLLVLANQDPKKFKEGMKNANSIRKVHIMKAAKLGIIVCDNKRNEIRWPDGKMLKQVPLQKDAIDYLVELSFQPAYEEVYSYIKETLNPEPAMVKTPGMEERAEDVPVSIPEVPVVTPQTPQVEIEEQEQEPPMPKTQDKVDEETLAKDIRESKNEDLYDLMFNNGLIYTKGDGPHYYVTGTEPGHLHHTAGIGKKGFCKKIRKNRLFKTFIYKMLKEKELV